MRKKFLAPAAWLYRSAIAARNKMYDFGIAKSHASSVPVIAIGNITTGGSGKTPCALFVLELLLRTGHRPALISRGYGRDSQGVAVVSDAKSILVGVRTSGDEAMLIAQRLPGVIVVVGERRIDAARAAISRGADCIVADDAFQHRSLFREMDIVMTGNELMHRAHSLLPAGNGREPLRSLRRADVIMSTAQNEDEIRRTAAIWSIAPVMFADVNATELVDPNSGAVSAIEMLRGQSVLLLTGIAHPERVAKSVIASGATIVEHLEFPDHHWFTSTELHQAAHSAEEQHAIVVTTEKDWVRFSAVHESSVIFRQSQLRVLRVAMQLRHNDDQLEAQILLQLKK